MGFEPKTNRSSQNRLHHCLLKVLWDFCSLTHLTRIDKNVSCNSPSCSNLAFLSFFLTHPCYVWNRWELQDRLQLEALSLLRAQPGFSIHLNQAKLKRIYTDFSQAPSQHLGGLICYDIQTKRNRFGVFPGRFLKHETKPTKKNQWNMMEQRWTLDSRVSG